MERTKEECDGENKRDRMQLRETLLEFNGEQQEGRL